MADPRYEQIMVAVLANLKTIVAINRRAYRSEGDIADDADCPYLRVLMGAERRLKQYTSGRSLWHLPISIIGIVRSTNDEIETDINRLRGSVTIAMLKDIKQGLSFIINTEETDPTPIVIEVGGSKPTGTQDWGWQIQYQRNDNDPTL